jgi:hypothetical protein
MRARSVALLMAAATVACSQVNGGANAPATDNLTDPDVRRLHARMIDAMGGDAAWQRARYFEFDFVVERGGNAGAGWSHRWDRYTGDYRLSGTRAGEALVVLMNVNSPDEGRAWVDGQPIEGPRLDSLRTFAYGRFINDSYWLIMPYKWTDPGVTLTYEGPRNEADRDWEVVKLSFDEVGLTPQNEYFAYLSPETGLMERWYHFSRAEANPSIYDWNGWQQFGPIRLATEKPNPDRTAMIRFENVRVESRVPDGVFVP